MSYLVLARKYRPQIFDEVVEQSHITTTLTNAISAGRVAHAILFSGPRGTGKTTVARILAKALNCKDAPTTVPCNICRSCNEITNGNAVDVFEIDGASNNSVDQVRELRENLKYMPAHSPYKIYIIDEVHMLSMAAFNALLKTLEEPPSHVLFMFATTEPHKIPITILSRCQRHDFRRISLEAISTHMASLCRQEQFEITDESLGLIAREAGGSMRDALSLLDQIMTCTQGAMSHEQVLEILGVIDRKIIFDLSASILAADIHTALDLLDDIYDRGHDIKKLFVDLLEHFRNLLIANMGKKIDKLVDLPSGEVALLVKQAESTSTSKLDHIFDLFFKAEVSIRLSPQPKLALEMALIRMLQAEPVLPIDALIDKLDTLRQEILAPGFSRENSENSSISRIAENDPPFRSQAPSAPEPLASGLKSSGDKTEFVSDNKTADTDLTQTWKRICEIVSNKNQSLAVSLLKCKLKKSEQQSLEIEVTGPEFTLNMIQREKNLKVLKQVCEDVFGHRKDIRLILANPAHDYSRKKKNDNQFQHLGLKLLGLLHHVSHTFHSYTS